MFIVPSCSCLCSIYWSLVLSREWRCSWSSADTASTTSEWSAILLPSKVWLILAVWQYSNMVYMNMRQWHFDAIFLNCSCMCKLVQSWYSPASVNINLLSCGIHSVVLKKTCYFFSGLVSTLQGLNIANNPLEFPPPEVIEKGTHVTLTFLRELLHAKSQGRLPPGGKCIMCLAHSGS